MTDDPWSVEVGVEGDDAPSGLLDEIAGAVRWTLTEEDAAEVRISVALVSDDAIAALNRDYLSHEGPTDVISFPLQEPGTGLVGDIYVGFAQAERQAADLGILPREELIRLVIHGTLHVLGWEHPEEGDRRDSAMYLRQEALLASFLARS